MVVARALQISLLMSPPYEQRGFIPAPPLYSSDLERVGRSLPFYRAIGPCSPQQNRVRDSANATRKGNGLLGFTGGKGFYWVYTQKSYSSRDGGRSTVAEWGGWSRRKSAALVGSNC